MGRAFYRWLINPHDKPILVDFEHIENNNFAVVDELTFGKEGSESEKEGSFRPDITILINGIPLCFLEVKHPNNEGGIQAEFNRMLNKRLEKPEYKKYFNMLQVVAFSNNMEYEDEDDSAMAEDVKAGSFYTTPNGFRTTFSFFREESPKTTGFVDISTDKIKAVLKDNHYSPAEADTPEFHTNLDMNTPCNRFVTSLFAKERITYFLRYGITYVDGAVPEKHIMRYPQFFASKALMKRLDNGGKSGIIWHTQGSGKTELAAFSTRILRDYYAKKSVTARFYYVVDRLDLLTQVSREMSKRGLNVINVNSKSEFERELNKPISDHVATNTDGEITVVNIQKFDDEMPVAKNDYNANIQRVIFIDEAHRSYRTDGEFFKNLMLVDVDAVYVALTGTPLLSKKERSNLEAMAKLLYDYWFVQFDFPDENGKPYKSSGGKMVWNEDLKREIPAGWEAKVLSDIAVFSNEKIEAKKLSSHTYIGMDNLVPNMKGRTESNYTPDEGLITAFQSGDVLVGNIRPYFKKIWFADLDGGASPDVLVIRAKHDKESAFVYSLLARNSFFDYDTKGAKGSKMPRGDKNHIMKYPFAYSNALAIMFSHQIGMIMNKISRVYKENQQLASLCDFLLPMLMNGQV